MIALAAIKGYMTFQSTPGLLAPLLSVLCGPIPAIDFTPSK
jgi:hypothetical protein